MQAIENKAAVAWVMDELKRAELEKRHEQIVIDIIDGKAHNLATTHKALVQKLICKS